MKCACGKRVYYEADNPPEVFVCDECIDAEYEHSMARHRSKRVQFTGEIVTIDKVDFECDGYYMDGGLNDLYVKSGGQDVYGCLAYHLQVRIDKELIRRMKAQAIIRRCKEIEKELPTSKDPARLRLERADCDSELEKLEVGV